MNHAFSNLALTHAHFSGIVKYILYCCRPNPKCSSRWKFGHFKFWNVCLCVRHPLAVGEEANAVKMCFPAYTNVLTAKWRMICLSEITVQWAILWIPSPVGNDSFETICKESIRGMLWFGVIFQNELTLKLFWLCRVPQMSNCKTKHMTKDCVIV